MSMVEKIVRKSEKVNEVFVARRVFCKLAIIFLLILIGIMIIFWKYLENINLTDTKSIIIITSFVITYFEFLIFMLIAAIIECYRIFLEAIQRTKSSIIQKKSIKPILGDDMLMTGIVGFILIIIGMSMMFFLDSCLNLADVFFIILFVILLIALALLSIFLGERLANHFKNI